MYLNRNRRERKQLYNFGKRKLQVIHTRIRTSCSSLNYHLFSKNIVASPLCECGSVESAQHYFFECPLYDHIRPLFITSISNHTMATVHTVLYGDDSKDYDTNIKIFEIVHKYIESSKRFDWLSILLSQVTLALTPAHMAVLFLSTSSDFQLH